VLPPTAPASLAAPSCDDAEADFAALVSDVASVIEHTMPPWRVQLGEAVARWRAEGVRTAVLERALGLPHDPGAAALLETFAAAVARLRTLEREAAAADPRLAGAPCFRDPEQLRDATRAAAEASAAARAAARPGATPARAPRAAAVRPDAERWVLAWPDADALLVEDAA
jgi:ABC-type transporter Mla subunit MlaD